MRAYVFYSWAKTGNWFRRTKGKEQDSWYVAHKDLASNELTVVQGNENKLLLSEGCFVDDIHWINERPESGLSAMSKLDISHPSKIESEEVYNWLQNFIHKTTTCSDSRSISCHLR